MKAVVLILLLVFVISGCGDTTTKNCNSNEECKVMYNVRFNGECSAGCFNSQSTTDIQCNREYAWEPIPYQCECSDNLCSPNI